MQLLALLHSIRLLPPSTARSAKDILSRDVIAAKVPAMGRFSSGNNADPHRLERMLNAKQRLIGVDVMALNFQKEEKKQMQTTQRIMEQQYAEETASHMNTLALQEMEARSMKKEWEKEVHCFRSTSQGKSTTREWDLNRPDALQIDAPARVGDDDPRCGAASLQKFAGEDLMVGERTAAQMEQCKSWWDEQSAMRAAEKQQQLHDKQRLAQHIKTLDSLQCTAITQESAARVALERQVAATNKELRGLQAAKKSAECQAEQQANLAELSAAAADPWLNEDPDQAASVMSPVRVRKDHWKGMSQAQKKAIIQQQLAQVEARKAQAAAAAAEEAAAAAARHNIQKAVAQQALAVDAFKRKQAQAAADVLKHQMAAKAAKDAATKQLYANQVTEDYFRQFGTSHR